MKYEIVVTADTNDADYITKTSEIDDAGLVEIMPVIEAIKGLDKKHHYNWPRHEYQDETVEAIYPQLTKDQIEAFEEYRPYGEYGIHTIESVVYYLKPDKVKLL